MADTSKNLRDTFRSLPKIDLHCHAEGALPLETLWEFHEKTGRNIFPDFSTFKNLIEIPKGKTPGFSDFLDRFRYFRFYMGDFSSIERIGREMVNTAAEDGVIHLELRFSPLWMAGRTVETPNENDLRAEIQGADDETIQNAIPTSYLNLDEKRVESAMEAFLQGAQSAAAEHNMTVVFICCLLRNIGLDGNQGVLDLLEKPLGKEFAALDLAGHESFPAEPFRDIFRKWKDGGGKLTVHAGEVDEDGSQEPLFTNMKQAVNEFGAVRIGHGVAAHRSKEIQNLLKSKNILLEMCPTSNVQTKAVSSFQDHPLSELMNNGITVTINSDDPTICNTTMTDELMVAVSQCGISIQKLKESIFNSVAGSFISEIERATLRERIETSWNQLSEIS